MISHADIAVAYTRKAETAGHEYPDPQIANVRSFVVCATQDDRNMKGSVVRQFITTR